MRTYIANRAQSCAGAVGRLYGAVASLRDPAGRSQLRPRSFLSGPTTLRGNGKQREAPAAESTFIRPVLLREAWSQRDTDGLFVSGPC